MSMNAIETNGLSRTFGRLDAVRGLDLKVPAGSLFALIGPNAAGKTTTIKMLLNLVRPTAGSATVLGTAANALGPAEWQRIGYVSENQELPDWMTPAEFLAYCRPFYPAWDDDLCARLQASLRLTSPVSLKASSRGTRMKAALLSSLAYRPDLVVLDEPFSGLDPIVRDELVRSLLEVPRDRGWTVLVSSHDVEEVERLADWVGFMVNGRLLFAEPVESLLNRYRLIEVVPRQVDAALTEASSRALEGWLPQGAAGRTLRFVDTAHHPEDTRARIASAFPEASVHVTRLGLRDIFLTIGGGAGVTVEAL
jgi:ABC-2 type transport system ATP-binding protein